MSNSLRLVDLKDHGGFNAMVQGIDWAYGQPPSGLCVLMSENKLGCLAVTGTSSAVRDDRPTPIESVLMVSDYRFGWTSVMAPTNTFEVHVNGGRVSVQDENLAKGVGILGANTPKAHARKNNNGPIAAVRRIKLPNQSLEDIYVGEGDASLGSNINRFWQHGSLLTHALVGDIVNRVSQVGHYDGKKPGTEAAVAKMSSRYGNAVCALLPMSPLYYLYQINRKLLPEDVLPCHVLANGNVEHPQALYRYGTCEIPYPRSKK